MAKKATPNAKRESEHDDSNAVDALVEAMDSDSKAIVTLVRTMILKSNGQITEGVKWNSPSFYWSGWFATLNVRTKAGVTLVLHHGAVGRPESTVKSAITDPLKLLKWHSADRASIALISDDVVNQHHVALAEIINHWATFHSELPKLK